MADPQTVAGWTRAATLIELGRPAEAKKLLLDTIGPTQLGSRGWCLVAQCDLALEDPGAALSATDQAIWEDPANEWSYRLRSMALSRLNRPGEAVAAASEAVRLLPYGWQSHATLASALIATRRVDEALRSADRAVECDPTVAEAHFVRGLALGRLGRTADARSEYETALRLDPAHSNARNNLGVLAMKSRKLGAAADHFASAVVADPSNQLAARNIQVVGRNLVRRLSVLVLLCMVPLGVVSIVDPNGSQSFWTLVLPTLIVLAAIPFYVAMVRRLPKGVVRSALSDTGNRVVTGVLLGSLVVLIVMPFLVAQPGDAFGVVAPILIWANVAARLIQLMLGRRAKARAQAATQRGSG